MQHRDELHLSLTYVSPKDAVAGTDGRTSETGTDRFLGMNEEAPREVAAEAGHWAENEEGMEPEVEESRGPRREMEESMEPEAEEGREPRAMPSPPQPSQKEIDDHALTLAVQVMVPRLHHGPR